MKIATLLRYYLLCTFIYIGLLQAEGFTAKTLVATHSGYTEIEQLQIGDTVISATHAHTAAEYPITNVTTFIVDYYIKIGIDSEYIYAAPDQKFYLYDHKKWMPASQLQPADLLIRIKGQSVCIDTIEIIDEPCIMYLLSVGTSHIFCVSHANIIAHNFAEVVVVPIITCTANFVITNAPAIIEVAKAAFATVTFLGAYFIQKRSEKRHYKAVSAQEKNSVVSTNFNNNNNWQDPEDDKKDKHPNGIYEGSKYHHQNSKNGKSPAPKNGQECLDNSLPVKQTKQSERIAIEDGTFVILKYTSPGKYHGYVVEWDQLEEAVQTFLRKEGFTTRKGKIIKQIIQEVL